MAQFKDCLDRVWSIRIHPLLVESVKEKTGLNVLDWFSGTLQKQLIEDEMRVFALLWALVETQAAGVSVTRDQFSEGLSGEVLDSALGALVEAIIDFRQNPELRAGLREASRLCNEAKAKAGEIFKAKIAETSVEHLTKTMFEEAQRNHLAATKSSNSVTSSAESQELTQVN